MEFKELVESRRSIRRYDETKKISKEQLAELVETALEAPSWKNSETARYYCVVSDEVITKIREEGLPEFNNKNSTGAAYIVTSFVPGISGYDKVTGEPTNECGNGWGYYDLGLASENIVLAARNSGLDTLIMGIRDSEKIKEVLDIPENEVVVSVIAVGYRAVNPEKPKRKSIAEVAKFV